VVKWIDLLALETESVG